MSNIGKITAFVIFICLFPLPVFAEETNPDFKFSVIPSFGLLYGRANEIVYKDSITENYLSELLWNIKPLYYAGLAADFGPVNNFARHGFIGNLSLKMGIPQRTGIIEDRDWFDYYWVPSGTLTHYSRHDNFSERAIMADLSLGYSFPLFNFVALGMAFDFSYMHFYWIAKNGYGQYLRADGIENVDYMGKTMIEYTQNWFIFSPGVFIKFRLDRFFSLYGNFNYSPLIYCADKDYHLLRDTIFQDSLFFGHYLNGGGGITFSIMDNLDITFFLSYSTITDSRGDSYFNLLNHTGIAGGGYSAFEFGLSARLRLFGL